MKDLLDAVQTALDAVRAVSSTRDACGMPPAELVAVADALGVLRRRVDAVLVPVAAEIARQSRPELGRDSLAKKQGFRTPGVMISTSTGTSTGEALRMVAVGEATAPQTTLTGQQVPPKHPHVADAIGAGELGTTPAAAIISMLDRVAPRCTASATADMEARLVDAARGLSMDQLHTLLVRAEAVLDPDGVEPKEEQLRAGRGVTLRQDPTGAIILNGSFDPETGAPILTALQGIVSGMLRRRDDGTSVADADPRTIAQMRADALSEVCRHMLGCEATPTGVSTTVVIRMNLDDLQAGVGCGSIDGIHQPVSAATVRRMAVDAKLIPCVLGGDSEILDWGRGKREFTRAQKLALSERDGGCTFCGAPPGIAAAHHIRWWARDAGPTDIDNGILLCGGCHHRIHDDGWDIRIETPADVGRGRGAPGSGAPGSGAGGRALSGSPGRLYTKARIWFIPPAWLDPARTPRLGGRARYDLTT